MQVLPLDLVKSHSDCHSNASIMPPQRPGGDPAAKAALYKRRWESRFGSGKNFSTYVRIRPALRSFSLQKKRNVPMSVWRCGEAGEDPRSPSWRPAASLWSPEPRGQARRVVVRARVYSLLWLEPIAQMFIGGFYIL